MGLAPANVEPVVFERFNCFTSVGLSAAINDDLFDMELSVEVLLLNA